MKKILISLIAFVLIAKATDAASLSLPVKSNEILIPIGNTGKTISLQDLSTISVKNFEDLTGKKLTGADRVMFKSAQRKIRRSINDDGTINNRQVEKFAKKLSDGDSSGFNVGGFALGLLLGLIGVLIAYIINNDNNSNRRKWAWIGFGVLVVILIIASL